MAVESVGEALLSVLPAPGEWRDEDYLWVTRNTRRLVELHAGKIEILPMPTQQHQMIVAAIFLALHAHLASRDGVVLFAPLRLRIAEGRYREPDVCVLLSATDARAGDAFWSGADLVVEVLSPDDPQRDLVTKRAEYALAGVAEYWIVDPTKRAVTVLTLEGPAYREAGVFESGSPLKSAILPSLEVSVETLFNR